MPAAAEHYLARRATAVLGVSPDLVRRAAARGGRARLVPVGAAPLPPPGRSARRVRAELAVGDRALLVCVARLAAQKGLDVLVDAACLLAGHPRRPAVVIAGDGPLRTPLAARIAGNNAPVRLLGHRRDVADLLAAADLAVLPSRWEGSPLAAHEALQAGRPLVATAVGGVPALTGPDAAVLVPPGDAGALAQAIAGLLDDRAAAQALARRALARARQWPGAADAAVRVLAVYAELLG
jgi:glycosyltransferase involved in cell wall biosynthesis